VYTITNRNIIQAIIDLVTASPTIVVKIITDDVQTKIPSQKALLDKLLSAGVHLFFN
jgi:hypothetical protein